MLKILRIILPSVLAIFMIKPGYCDPVQEVTIPGYNPNATSSVAPTPVATPPKPVVVKPKPVAATSEELQQIIETVNFSGWSKLPAYLWTCTPNTFLLPRYDVREEIKAKFDEYKNKKKLLTLADAKEIANKLAAPVPFKIVGLWGSNCHVNMAISADSALDCFMIILDARYLSRLTADIAASNGKESLPKETHDALIALFAKNCTKKSTH